MTAVRVALAVLLAVSLFAAVAPAVDDAATANAHAHVRTAATRLERVAHALLSGEDGTRSTRGGARRPLTLSVPARSFTTAGVERVAIGGAPGSAGDRSVVVYALDDGARRTLSLDGVSLRTPGGPVVLGPGQHRLTLSLVAADDGAHVVLRR